jgi:Primase X
MCIEGILPYRRRKFCDMATAINKLKLGIRSTLLPSQTFLENLDVTLGYFEEPIFPRTMSTLVTQGRQIIVYAKEELISAYIRSDLIDCRVNAYPIHTEYKGINRQAPNFIFIDLDKSGFKSERSHKLALDKSLRRIKETIGGYPTVIQSGNGYHIYQPIEAFPLEQEDTFSDFDQPSKTFLRFAERYLSANKSDPSHNPSFKSCMVRIPGSYNSKCIQEYRDSEIKVVQRWNGHRPKINLLLGTFYAYLVDQQIEENERQKEISRYQNNNKASSNILWIEKLLQTPIEDYRKNAVSLIIAPYLINIKKLSYDDALNAINSWLNRCGKLRRLDYGSGYRVKYALESSIKNGYKPLKFESLKPKNKILYDILS